MPLGSYLEEVMVWYFTPPPEAGGCRGFQAGEEMEDAGTSIGSLQGELNPIGGISLSQAAAD